MDGSLSILSIFAFNGFASAKWLVYEFGLDLSKLQFRVHSANPVAAEQIRGLLTNYIHFLNSEKE